MSSQTGAGPAALSGKSTASAASKRGGGAKLVRDCMKFWDPATHMTHAEWRAACKRTMNRVDGFQDQP